MTAAQCLCGFTELDDETILDHLHRILAPEDGVGNDGQVHDEGEPLTCLCGLAAATAGELDRHLIEVFTPDDAIGRDGKKHGPVQAADGS